MKLFQLVLLVSASFGAGFFLADGLAKSAPELVLVQEQPPAVASGTEKMKCEVATLTAQVRADQFQPADLKPVKDNTAGPLQTAEEMTMPLESYSALVASEQRPATELILQIDEADFAQMIEQQQQDLQFDAQSDQYQQQLSEFIHAYPEIVQSRLLTCSSKFCLVELEVHNFAAWPTVFKTLTAQQWWQSISYQRLAEHAGNSSQQSSRITLLLQQDWVPVGDQQQLAVAEGGLLD